MPFRVFSPGRAPSPTVSPKSFLMSDYTEAIEVCQPAAPDPGVEVGLPSKLGVRWPRTSNMPRARLGTVFLGDLDLFSTQPRLTRSQQTEAEES